VAIAQALPSNSSFSAARAFEAAVSDSSFSKSTTRRAASSFTACVLSPALLVGDSEFAGRARRAFVHGIPFGVGAFVARGLRLAAQWAHRQVETLLVAGSVHLAFSASSTDACGTFEAWPNPALKRTRRKRASFGVGGEQPFAALVARLPARRLALR
jgi:hypothetical protein